MAQVTFMFCAFAVTDVRPVALTVAEFARDAVLPTAHVSVVAPTTKAMVNCDVCPAPSVPTLQITLLPWSPQKLLDPAELKFTVPLEMLGRASVTTTF